MQFKNFWNKYNIYILTVLIAVTFFLWVGIPSWSTRVSSDAWDGSVSNSFNNGNGSPENPYLISSAGDFAYFKSIMESADASTYANKYYKITNSFDYGNYNMSINNIIPFTGTIDGTGLTIQDGTLTAPLFQSVENATIKNIDFEDIITNISTGNASILASSSTSSTFETIIIKSTVTITDNNTYGGLVFTDNGSTFTNVVIANDYLSSATNTTTQSSFLNSTTNTIINHVLIKSNSYADILNNTNTNIDTIDHYTVSNNTITIANSGTMESYQSETYQISISNTDFAISEIPTLVSGTITRMPLLTLNTPVQLVEHASGISGDTVYVNDLTSDYNYYYGLNYTYNASGTLPTTENKNIYTSANLVKVQMTYNGADLNDSSLVGYVSTTEAQSKYVYFKYYVVENNYITVELIDNPFTNRPTDKAFENWTTDYSGATISYNPTYYTRSVKIPVTMTNGTPDDIVITMHALWVDATVSRITSTTNSWTNAFASLNEIQMKQIGGLEPIYEDISNLYIKKTASRWEDYPDNAYNASGGSLAGSYCRYYSCTYYALNGTASYDSTAAYYELSDGYMTEYTVQITGYNTIPGLTAGIKASGYYKIVNVAYGASYVGYYNSTGEYQTSGTCYTSGGCTYYELQQYYAADGTTINVTDGSINYYYLVTRDTNIIVLQANTTSTWSSAESKPFTLTSVYNGTDYRNSAYFNVQSLSVFCYADTVIENIKVYSTTSYNADTTRKYVASGTTNRVYLYGNWHNVKVGRGLTANGNYVNFDAFLAGNNSSTGSTNNTTKYHLVVESGRYNVGSLTNGSSSGYSSIYVEGKGTYGNDYDRVNNNNTNFIMYNCLSGTWGFETYSSSNTTPATISTYKSGTFGQSQRDNITGIYVGGRQYGTIYAPRVGYIEGGWFYNVIGGPITDSSQAGYNDTYIYIKGGEIGFLWGGAGRSATYGNRIIQMTDGTVDYSVFGGSNASGGSEGDGTVNGTSYVYVGGNALVGDPSTTIYNTPKYNAESGSIFGNGCGKTGSSTIGSNDNAIVILDGNATVTKNIYGGGNFGATGVSSSSSTTYTTINLLGGNVKQSVYGGGNNNGSGSSDITSTININLKGSTIDGSVYGGSRTLGTIYGNTNVNILSGAVTGSVYGGGEGGYASSSNSGTFVSGTVNVNVGNGTTTPTISTNVYGGSAFGTVNGITSTQTTTSTDTTNVTINSGTITGSVFGGGQGSTTYTPHVYGNITVTMNNGNATNVYGGNDQAGLPLGEVYVYLKGGTINSAFGGGNASSVTTSHVYQQGTTANYVYGGSNNSGTVTTSNVEVTGGTTGTVFGGNNVGGSTTTSNVKINGGTISTAVYGGGNEVATTTTNVTLTSALNTIPSVFGGGKSANATTTNIIENGASVTNIFGGSDASGSVGTSNITHNSGTTTNIYGGNNAGGNTIKATINYVNGTTTNIYGGGNAANSGTTTINVTAGTIQNIFGGGNQAGVTTSTTNINGGTINSVYGGSNNSGTVTTTNVNVNGGTITTVYGGNNAGGTTVNPTVTINNGNVTTVYGGGNLASGTTSDVIVNGGTIKTLFGGGNAAAITTNSIVDINGGTISDNVYGGGNYGTVNGNTYVTITNGTIIGDAYAGGNGSTAIVSGNTTITIDGNTVIGTTSSVTPSQGCVFGGGNAAATGNSTSNNSVGTVNIVGGHIYGNVYGAANTSVLYGTATVNIGYDAVANTALTLADVNIKGTIFGGGEANAAGSETYDYSFISVTNGITINIDGNGYTNFDTHGSIFGSGDASSTSGTSTISIKNYGTSTVPKKNISIQRTNTLTIDNSGIVLTGATDRTNEYSDVLFSLSIIDDLKLRNNSSLFLENGGNLLKKFESQTSTGATATVTIDASGNTTKNVDNRLYMYAGRNLNIATNESVTSYGEVYGMTFFGMYTYDRDGNVLMGIYKPSIQNGDTLDWADAPTKGSYVLGLHKTNHNIEVDGFYTNYMDSTTAINKVGYITPTPDDSNFYMWVIGESVIEYSVNLIASKYSTLGSTELTFLEFSDPNTSFQILGFDDSGLASGINLVDKNNIPKIASSSTIANSNFGISMESSNTGWLTDGTTNFYSSTPSITGTKYYAGENSSVARSMLFYIYHSKNITLSQNMGTVDITIMAITQVDALNKSTRRLVIHVNLSSALYQTNEYEAAMTPGDKYSIFASTTTNITATSKLSAYFALYGADANLYQTGYHRSLVSDYVLPLNTKITMIDLVDGNPRYYYHTITATDVTNATADLAANGEAAYNFSLFTNMGSTSSTAYYSDSAMNSIYYNGTDSSEEFVFIVDFADANITSDQLSKSLLVELRNASDQVMISVLGIEHQKMIYSLYTNKNAVINVSATLSANPLYVGYNDLMHVTTNYVNSTVGSNSIFDTQYFDSKLGLKLTLKDKNGNQVTGTGLLGAYFTLNGVDYYPNLDGSTRIKIADKVGNVASWITLNTTNASIATGDYTLSIESFGSPDGIYYGDTSSSTYNIPITIVNSSYGLKASMENADVVLDSTLSTNNLKFNLTYSSELTNPSLRVKMYRRKYDTVYDTNYELVDLQTYATDTLTTTSETSVYLLTSTPQATNNFTIPLNTGLLTGTYRLDFMLYDNNTMIGTVSKYIIIRGE